MDIGIEMGMLLSLVERAKQLSAEISSTTSEPDRSLPYLIFLQFHVLSIMKEFETISRVVDEVCSLPSVTPNIVWPLCGSCLTFLLCSTAGMDRQRWCTKWCSCRRHDQGLFASLAALDGSSSNSCRKVYLSFFFHCPKCIADAPACSKRWSTMNLTGKNPSSFSAMLSHFSRAILSFRSILQCTLFFLFWLCSTQTRNFASLAWSTALYQLFFLHA